MAVTSAASGCNKTKHLLKNDYRHNLNNIILQQTTLVDFLLSLAEKSARENEENKYQAVNFLIFTSVEEK